MLKANDMQGIEYVEPFTGGASLALGLLFEGHAEKLHINDLSKPIYAFWHCVLNETDDLCDRIEQTEITIKEWRKHREIVDAHEGVDLKELGFSTFFLNRTNRSGIIMTGGVIGGQEQNTPWPLDARFNKQDLLKRIRRIAERRDQISLHQMEALSFIDHILPSRWHNTFTLLDPPYISSGSGLYLNNYTMKDHHALAERVMRIKSPWVVTYDYDAAVASRLYPNHCRIAFNLSYSANDRRSASEAMFLSPHMELPEEWLTRRGFKVAPRPGNRPVVGEIECYRDYKCETHRMPPNKKPGLGLLHPLTKMALQVNRHSPPVL